MEWSPTDSWITPALAGWLAALVGEPGVAIAFGPPAADGGPRAAPATPAPAADLPARAARGVNLHLLSVAPHAHAVTRTERRAETWLALRYLTTAWASDADAADRLLCQLAFALLGRGATGPDGRSEIAIEAAPPSLELLAALGVPPRPALVVALPLTQIERAAPAPRVTHLPIVRVVSARTLSGTLLGPDDVPIAAAEVELAALGRVATTDPDGRFELPGVPAELTGQAVRVRAHGVERVFRLPAADGDGPLMLRLSFAEEG